HRPIAVGSGVLWHFCSAVGSWVDAGRRTTSIHSLRNHVRNFLSSRLTGRPQISFGSALARGLEPASTAVRGAQYSSTITRVPLWCAAIVRRWATLYDFFVTFVPVAALSLPSAGAVRRTDSGALWDGEGLCEMVKDAVGLGVTPHEWYAFERLDQQGPRGT